MHHLVLVLDATDLGVPDQMVDFTLTVVTIVDLETVITDHLQVHHLVLVLDATDLGVPDQMVDFTLIVVTIVDLETVITDHLEDKQALDQEVIMGPLTFFPYLNYYKNGNHKKFPWIGKGGRYAGQLNFLGGETIQGNRILIKHCQENCEKSSDQT